jgi:hypothetical protein
MPVGAYTDARARNLSLRETNIQKTVKVKVKGKVHPRTGHEDPDGGVEV